MIDSNKKERVENLFNRNKRGETLNEIAKSLNLDPSSISKLFSRYGYKPVKHEHHLTKKWKCSYVDYFKNINTKEKAYFLGLIFSDGNISSKNVFSIGLKSSDVYILNRLKEVTGSKSKIYYKEKTNSYNFSICSKEFCFYLRKYGIVERKSYEELSIPNVKENLLKSFLLGIFDGDGSIGIYKKSIQISISSSSLNFINEIQKLLEKNGISSRIQIRIPKKENHNNLYILHVTKDKSKLNMINFLYKSLNHICLERKRKIASDVNTVLNQKLNVSDQCNA